MHSILPLMKSACSIQLGKANRIHNDIFNRSYACILSFFQLGRSTLDMVCNQLLTKLNFLNHYSPFLSKFLLGHNQLVNDLHSHKKSKTSCHNCKLQMNHLQNQVFQVCDCSLISCTISCFYCDLSFICNANLNTFRDNLYHPLDQVHSSNISKNKNVAQLHYI